MISVKFDSAQFTKEMNNIMQYATGFLEGAQKGKTVLFQRIGAETIELMKQFIDANARTNPAALHHVYEWYQTGSPDARLFDLEYTISNLGLSFRSTFSQSTSVREGSKTPFYDKARMMESGVSITVRPRTANVLRFEADGETVYTPNPVEIRNPGGEAVAGSFERVFDSFFGNYFTQSFLRISGLLDHISDASIFKKNLPSGKRSGKAAGLTTGYRWISNVKVAK